MSRPQNRRFGRRARAGEQGLSLIDALVAIAITTVAIVAIVGGFANAARSATIASEQSTLTTVIQNTATWVQSPNVDYQFCPANANAYTTALGSEPPPNLPSGYKITVSWAHADSGSAVTNGKQESSLTTSCVDYGIQRLTVTVTAPNGRQVTQVVYKGAGLAKPTSSPGGGGGGGLQQVSYNCSPVNSGEPYIFYVGGKEPAKGATPQCAVIVPAGGNITAGSTIGVVYDDEKDINKTGGLINGTQTTPPTFKVDGVAQTVTLTYQGTQWVYNLTITLPADLAPGSHTAIVSAYDTDQNKGGDFGQTTFTFTSS